MISIYLIGSLRNRKIPLIGKKLRESGFEVFDDWFAAGRIADDEWQRYEQTRGRTYPEALQGYAAENVFNFDLRNLKRCNVVVLVLPAGKSAHIELGYCIGSGQKGYVLFEKVPVRWDVMYRFAQGVFFDLDSIIDELKNLSADRKRRVRHSSRPTRPTRSAA